MTIATCPECGSDNLTADGACGRCGWAEEKRQAQREAAARAKADREAEALRAMEARRAQHAAAEAHRLAMRWEERRKWEYQLRALSLTCARCGQLAVPIPATRDRYGCPACNHQFVGAPHDMPLPPAQS